MTPNQWQHHIKAWQQINQSKHAYCRDNGLAYSRFLYWSNKRAKPRLESVASDTELLPVTIKTTESETDCLGVLEFPNGTKLHIHSTELLSSLPKLPSS